MSKHEIIVEQCINGTWAELTRLGAGENFNPETDIAESLESMEKFFTMGEINSYKTLQNSNSTVVFCRGHGPLRARIIES